MKIKLPIYQSNAYAFSEAKKIETDFYKNNNQFCKSKKIEIKQWLGLK